MYYQTHRIDQRGAGGSGNSENFINTNIYSDPENSFIKYVIVSFDFWNKEGRILCQSIIDGEFRGNNEI